MAMTGSLAECGPAQVVRLITQGRKSGRLTVQGSKGSAECYFRDGRLDAAYLPDTRPLIDTLSGAGLLTDAQCDSLKPYGVQSEKALVNLLVGELGYVERPRLLGVLRTQTTEAVQTIFRWDRGTFRLDESVSPPEGMVALGIDLTGLVAVAPSTTLASGAEAGPTPATPEAPAPKPRRWWDWLRGGKDDRR